jgi:hypothetical protein
VHLADSCAGQIGQGERLPLSHLAPASGRHSSACYSPALGRGCSWTKRAGRSSSWTVRSSIRGRVVRPEVYPDEQPVHAGAPDPAGRVELELPPVRLESKHGGAIGRERRRVLADDTVFRERGRESRVVLPIVPGASVGTLGSQLKGRWFKSSPRRPSYGLLQ